MNCFPCKGPACNACGKFTSMNARVAVDNSARCTACGGRVNLENGCCLQCGRQVIAVPGSDAKRLEGRLRQSGSL